jgi:adenylosuccinate synthase
MSVQIVLGAQWGDEGKGKIVDAFSEKADIVIRFNGGGNAGHTIVVGDKKEAIHLCPSGIVRKGVINIVGPGVVFDLSVGSREIQLASSYGSRVLLDQATPVVLPMHRVLDAGRESAAGKSAIGTTKRGIGPAYSDFWLRRGLRLGDLTSRSSTHNALVNSGYFDELLTLARHFGVENGKVDLSCLNLGINPLSLDETIDWCMKYAGKIIPHLADTRQFVHKAIREDRDVLFEGAQGVLLDTMHGFRPFTTSSCCTAAGVAATFGVFKFDRVIGVAKAYCTRVGAGPFPTELTNGIGEKLRYQGNEYGTTTGRPRRCGWIDLRALSYACRVGGITNLIVTKLDVLSGFESLKYCYDYENIDSQQTLTTADANSATPQYSETPGWSNDITSARSLEELPDVSISYLNEIENHTGIPIDAVGIGPERDQIIWRSR